MGEVAEAEGGGRFEERHGGGAPSPQCCAWVRAWIVTGGTVNWGGYKCGGSVAVRKKQQQLQPCAIWAARARRQAEEGNCLLQLWWRGCGRALVE